MKGLINTLRRAPPPECLCDDQYLTEPLLLMPPADDRRPNRQWTGRRGTREAARLSGSTACHWCQCQRFAREPGLEDHGRACSTSIRPQPSRQGAASPGTVARIYTGWRNCSLGDHWFRVCAGAVWISGLGGPAARRRRRRPCPAVADVTNWRARILSLPRGLASSQLLSAAPSAHRVPDAMAMGGSSQPRRLDGARPSGPRKTQVHNVGSR